MKKIPETVLKLGIASFWSIVFVAAFVTTTPKPWVLTIIGIGLGLISGHVRTQAILAGKAKTAANILICVFGIGLLVLAMAIAEDMFIGAWGASLAGCLITDCLYSLPASRRQSCAIQEIVSDRT